MTSTAVVTQGPSPEDDYGLDAIAQHNATTSAEHLLDYQPDAKGLGIYVSIGNVSGDSSSANIPLGG